MLDPDEVARYEEWKQRKIQGQLDLSVQAYNLEQESVALAWEDGWVARHAGKLFTDNQFRKPGMTGHRPPSATPPQPLPPEHQEEDE